MKLFLTLFILFMAGVKCHGMFRTGAISFSEEWVTGFQEQPTKGSSKAEAALEVMDKILLYQKFDRHLFEGDQRPNGQLPNFDALPDGSHEIRKIMGFFQGTDADKMYSFNRSILQPFASALKDVASLTHMYPELEVLGRWGDQVLWQGEGAKTLFKQLFKETEEFTHLRDFIKLLRLSALAVEADDLDEKKVTRQAVKDFLNNPTNMPTLLDKAYEGYLIDLHGHIKSIQTTLPENAETPANRLALIMSLIQTGELMKLTPSTYKTAPVSKELSQFRDKVLKIIPTKLHLLEQDTLKTSLSSVPGFLDTFTDWIDPSLDKPEPTTDVMEALREALGYKKRWKSKANNAPVPAPDQDFAKDIAEKMKTLLEHPSDVKSLAWEAVYMSLGMRLQTLNTPLFELQNIVDIAAQNHPSNNQIINDGRDVLKTLDVAPGESPYALLTKAQDTVYSYPEHLVQKGLVTQEQIDDVDWSDFRGFEINDMDRIRAELHRKRMVVQDPFSTPYQQRQSVKMLGDSFYNLGEDQFMTLKFLGYSLVQTILEYPQVFSPLDAYNDSITKIRKFWAHPRPDKEFPEIVTPYSDDTRKNESLALASLYFMIQEKL